PTPLGPPGGPQQTGSHCRIVLFRIKAARKAGRTVRARPPVRAAGAPHHAVGQSPQSDCIPRGPYIVSSSGGSKSLSGGPSVHESKTGGAPGNCASRRSTWLPENSAFLKLTSPPEDSANAKASCPPESVAPPKVTRPPENLA